MRLSLKAVQAKLAGLSPQAQATLDARLVKELQIRSAIGRLREIRRWSPRPYQEPLWRYLQYGGKRAIAVWHRRSGKDDVALNWTAESMYERVGEYWHMLPEASQARKAIWEAVNPHTGIRRINQAFPLELRARTRENEMVIDLPNGSIWRVVGSDNYDSLIGAGPVGVVFSEWALSDPSSWGFLRPMLVENGGWAIFITTPRGPNHAMKTLDLAKQGNEWFHEVLDAGKTGVFTEDQLAAELREMQFEYGIEEGRALYEQEYECSFESALLGSYYGASLNRMAKEGRLGVVPVDRGVLVHTGWDLGKTDSTAIWFVQCVGKERRIVDYYEGSGSDLDVYVQVLEDKRKQRGWIYGTHYFPHDVAHNQQGNPHGTRVGTLRSLGIRAKVVELGNVNDGINAVRRLLETAFIDEKNCERGLNTLRNYRRMWNEKTKMYSDMPLHDWASHGADGLRTFAVGYADLKPKAGRIPLPTFGVERVPQGTGWMAR